MKKKKDKKSFTYEEENYSDPTKMQALNEEIKAIEIFLEKAYEDWEKLI